MDYEPVVEIFRQGDGLCMIQRNGGDYIKTEEDIETALINIERKLRLELGLTLRPLRESKNQTRSKS